VSVSPRPARPVPGLVRAVAVAFGTCTTCGVLAVLSCGGTTGHEGLSSGTDIGADADSFDATTSDDAAVDAGTFDVGIAYATRELPDVTAPGQADALEAGYPWPNCPPFVPVTSRGRPTPEGTEVDQVPASFDDAGQVLLDDAGRVVPAPDASTCGGYGWLGSVQVDECTTQANAGSGAPPILLPPCNWCADAGVAGAGSMAGTPLYDLCLDLYQCLRSTACYIAKGSSQSVGPCLCGDSPVAACTPTGLCAAQELAALQYTSDPMSVQAALNHLLTTAAGPSSCAASLNQLFQDAVAGGAKGSCFPPDAGPF
jgi:hypothetical protein